MNITYLLGAGASFEALPVVNGIPKALDEFASDFNPGELYHIKALDFFNNETSNLVKSFLYKLENDETSQKEYFNKIKAFHKDIIWLKTEAENHTSIDTFAKKLYLQKDFQNLKKLKIILSCFFLYLQTKNFDKRYDSFFASILDDLYQLPGNLKILSWNYDSQLEIGFSNFSNETINKSKKILNLHSKGDIMYDAYSPDQFCVYKINGTTNIKKGEFDVMSVLEDFNIDETVKIQSFLDLHNGMNDPNKDLIMTFAWEDFNTEKGFFPNLSKSISETEILIVIGYSFPFFNRKIDKYILDSMPKLRKVYVQDPKNASDIIEKISGFFPNVNKSSTIRISRKIDFITKEFTDQFFIPIEF
ncbi:hypothetical protein [Yeosuana marina]|uniref:hypothetical protein n=1 Tax=Yeosuana marina TaxID=1565536 RepID=UPI0030C8A497